MFPDSAQSIAWFLLEIRNGKQGCCDMREYLDGRGAKYPIDDKVPQLPALKVPNSLLLHLLSIHLAELQH